MSRVAKKPVDLPQGVTVTIGGESVTVKGAKGSLTLALKTGIKVVQPDKQHLAVEASGDGEADGNSGQGHRPSENRPDGRRDSELSAAGTLQGQGREIFRREDFAERGEEEVSI